MLGPPVIHITTDDGRTKHNGTYDQDHVHLVHFFFERHTNFFWTKKWKLKKKEIWISKKVKVKVH